MPRLYKLFSAVKAATSGEQRTRCYRLLRDIIRAKDEHGYDDSQDVLLGSAAAAEQAALRKVALAAGLDDAQADEALALLGALARTAHNPRKRRRSETAPASDCSREDSDGARVLECEYMLEDEFTSDDDSAYGDDDLDDEDYEMSSEGEDDESDCGSEEEEDDECGGDMMDVDAGDDAPDEAPSKRRRIGGGWLLPTLAVGLGLANVAFTAALACRVYDVDANKAALFVLDMIDRLHI